MEVAATEVQEPGSLHGLSEASYRGALRLVSCRSLRACQVQMCVVLRLSVPSTSLVRASES